MSSVLFLVFSVKFFMSRGLCLHVREKRINTCISSKYTAVKGPAVAQNISLSEGASTGPQCSWNIDIGGCQARGAGMGGLSRLGHNGLETLSMSRVGISWIGL